MEGGESINFERWKQRREDMVREAEQNRLAKELRASHRRRGSGRASAPAWALRGVAGRLLKLSRIPRKPD